MVLNSCDADGLRASERRHAVRYAYADRHLGRLGPDLACPQAIACECLEPVHQVLDQRTPEIAAGLFPFAPATSGNDVNDLVAPWCAGRAVGPWHRSLTRRNRRLCIARGSRVALPDVVRAVAAKGVDRRVARGQIPAGRATTDEAPA